MRIVKTVEMRIVVIKKQINLCMLLCVSSAAKKFCTLPGSLLLHFWPMICFVKSYFLKSHWGTTLLFRFLLQFTSAEERCSLFGVNDVPILHNVSSN